MGLDLAAEQLYTRLSIADDLVSRLDERVAASPFSRGFVARRDFAEAVAWSWTQGSVTPLEDLVLHDQSMNVRTPTAELWAAHAVIQARRKAALAGPEIISRDGVWWLMGRRRRAPAPGSGGGVQAEGADDPDRPSIIGRIDAALLGLESGESGPAESGVDEWLAFLHGLDRRAPPLLRAAAMLEAWWIIDPMPRYRYVGAVLVGRWLSASGRASSHVLGLETGLRAIGRGRSAEVRSGRPIRRVSFWLAVIARAADDALGELHRLELARQVMVQRLAGRRSHARAQDVMWLLLESPVVTAPLIAERLGISQHGARRSLEELGSVVQEISGRSRFRAWRV